MTRYSTSTPRVLLIAFSDLRGALSRASPERGDGSHAREESGSNRLRRRTRPGPRPGLPHPRDSPPPCRTRLRPLRQHRNPLARRPRVHPQPRWRTSRLGREGLRELPRPPASGKGVEVMTSLATRTTARLRSLFAPRGRHRALHPSPTPPQAASPAPAPGRTPPTSPSTAGPPPWCGPTCSPPSSGSGAGRSGSRRTASTSARAASTAWRWPGDPAAALDGREALLPLH